MGVYIAGLGHAVPGNVLTNHDLEKRVDTSDEWIVARTGIRERRIADTGKGTSDLAVEAAQKAMSNAGVTAEDIDFIVVGTTTPDQPLPSCACYVQKKIGAKQAVAFDVAAACAGFVFALSTAVNAIKNNQSKVALVIGADQISPYIDWEDRSTCILFGDAAGACVLKEEEGVVGIVDTVLGSDGDYTELITIPAGGSANPATSKTIQSKGHFLKMNGSEVFKQAVRGMAGSIENLITRAQIESADIDWIIPHQANVRIINAVASKLNFDKDKIYLNLDRYGNTSAASVILALSEAVELGKIKDGNKILLTTFGAGLVWGSTLMEWKCKK